MAILLLLGSVAITGCQFAAGAATGALATGAGYEYNSKRQMVGSRMIIEMSESAGVNTKGARARSNVAQSFTNRCKNQASAPSALYDVGALV